MPNDHEKIEIDLQRKETEAGWIAGWDRFGLRAAPTWFNWVGWVLALGAIHYLSTKSHSIVLVAIISLSYAFLWFYFWGFFYRFAITGIPFVRTRKTAKFVSSIISGLLAFAAWHAATFVAREIARFQLSG